MQGKHLLASLLTLALVSVSLAQSNTTVGNTTVTANYLKFDYDRLIAEFSDDVVVDDPQIHMESDRLVVIFDKESEIRSITAIGNVRMNHEDKRATCAKAIYLAKRGEVVLTGNATLLRGRDTIKGKKIVFNLNDETMTCEPGRLVIFPSADRDFGGSPLKMLSGDKESDQ